MAIATSKASAQVPIEKLRAEVEGLESRRACVLAEVAEAEAARDFALKICKEVLIKRRNEARQVK